MILYLLNIRIMYVSDIVTYVITSIPQVATQYSFVLLAIDCVVGVAFPYHYRHIYYEAQSSFCCYCICVDICSCIIIIPAWLDF